MYSNDTSNNPDDCGGEALQGIGDGMRAMMDDPHGGTEVLFIRHAESRNNVLHAEVGARYNFDPNLHEIMEKEVASLRSEDADLSEKGFVQAERLGEYLAERLRKRRVLVVTSPMQRAIKTIRPLVTRLGIDPEDFACYGRYFEVGGCYLQDRVYTGTSRAELEGTYKLQCFDVEEEGWYAHSEEREGHPQALLRCEQAWLWIQDVLLAGEGERAGGRGREGRSKGLRGARCEVESLIDCWAFAMSAGALPNAVDGDGRGGGKGGGRGGGRSYDTIVFVGHGEFMHYVMKKYHPSRGTLVRSLNVLEHLPPSLRTGHALADGWCFENLPEEEPGLHMATQAIRQRYLPPSLPPYLTDVDAHSVHFLALSHGQVIVIPPFRNQGLGTGLVASVKTEARGRGKRCGVREGGRKGG
ncbi:hypothetical protein NSK_008331 [Nannochloropsis salina CCMP1776]|uniref:N-acetyltransferase domain-containing protein n=1 Tax=Nannochloropsis salina CCMP1776 TaxID=1027361 RepID=A0A4D9CNM4_9STRA|nr:hypothetical protein NSK_008331 [Nannochloropsis salina CCMP1776]|eukprot:TFJ80326.1 hypothetical protein NSK_008331 [Nannochloropsis salina CCMP1776]